MKIIPSFCIFFGLLLFTLANAGTGHSGGGDALRCQEKTQRIWTTESIEAIYLADTYDLFKQTSDQLIALNIGSPSASKEAALNVIEEQNPTEATLLRSALQKLNFIFVDHSLEDVLDDNLNPPKNCTKEQLAVQNFSTGKVYIQRSLYQQLSYIEQGLLLLHEAYVSLNSNQYDRSFIRKFVKSTVKSKSFYAHSWNALSNTVKISEVYDMAYASVISSRLYCAVGYPTLNNPRAQRNFKLLGTLMEALSPRDFWIDGCYEELDSIMRIDFAPLIKVYSSIHQCRLAQSNYFKKNELIKKAKKLRNDYLFSNRPNISLSMRHYAQQVGSLLCR